jgi:hypothetical protein
MVEAAVIRNPDSGAANEKEHSWILVELFSKAQQAC